VLFIPPALERPFLSLSICFYASLYYGPLFFPYFLLCALSMWAGTFCSTSTKHLEMSFSRCSSRQDQTRHASAVRLSFLLFSAEPFQLQNLYGGRNDLNHMLRFPSPLCLRRSRDQFTVVVACRSPRFSFSSPPSAFFSYASVVQAVHAPFRVLFFNASHASVVVPSPLFSRFLPSCPGCCFTCYRCI